MHLKPPVSTSDHIEGPESASVTLVEYGDFECPYCGRAYYAVRRLQERLGERLRFAFRHFPLEQHPHSFIAAEAAEAAGAQGCFWPMHDLLFENQEALDPRDILEYAEELQLDRERFVEALQSHAYADTVREDLRSGEASGVRGTPTFYINGEKHEGNSDFDSLWQAIATATGAQLIG